MSRTLARIRETVGDPIFVQAGRKMVPTPRARTARRRPRSRGARVAVARPVAEIDLGTLDKQFNVRANDIFVGLHSSRLLEEMARGMPRAMLRFMPEEDDIDDDALRSGRIDLFISASRRLRPEIRVQPLFTTTFVGLARDDHPIFDDDITPERFARWPHIGVSRRGKSAGPIDDALAARGLARQVLLVVPTPYAAIFALQASDLILPLPEHLARGAVRPSSACARSSCRCRSKPC